MGKTILGGRMASCWGTKQGRRQDRAPAGRDGWNATSQAPAHVLMLLNCWGRLHAQFVCWNGCEVVAGRYGERAESALPCIPAATAVWAPG